MPPAASALAAAPASICLRVRRTLLLRRPDDHEVPQHAVEVLAHLAVPERRRNVLAHRVERAAIAPGVQHVPLVGVLVHVEDRGVQPARTYLPARIAEARDQLALF